MFKNFTETHKFSKISLSKKIFQTLYFNFPLELKFLKIFYWNINFWKFLWKIEIFKNLSLKLKFSKNFPLNQNLKKSESLKLKFSKNFYLNLKIFKQFCKNTNFRRFPKKAQNFLGKKIFLLNPKLKNP